MLIDLARARARGVQAGAQTTPMTSSTLEQDVTASGYAENAPITLTATAFSRRTLTAKTSVAGNAISVELFEDAPKNIPQVVVESMASALALKMDADVLFGAGGLNIDGIRGYVGVNEHDLGTNGAQITFDHFSQAVGLVLDANGPDQGLAAIYSARKAGEIDWLKDLEGRYLAANRPPSWQALLKFTSNQIPNDLTQGTPTNSSEAYVGDCRTVLIGMRTQISIQVSLEASDPVTGLGFSTLSILVRGHMRSGMVLARPAHMTRMVGIM